MQIIADQNVHRQVVLRLRERGYAVEWIQETMPGKLDEELLARTDITEHVFITGDKGFGDWIFRQGLPRPFAIVLIRLPHPQWANTATRIGALLEQGVTPGHMITITRDGDRVRPFPTGVDNG